MLASSIAAARRCYHRHRSAIARGYLVALAATLAFLWFVEPTTLAHRLIRTDALPTDGAYVGRMITNDPRASAPDVLVIGGSSIQLLVPADADARMTGLCGAPTHLFNAATSSQHPADSRAILDALRRPPALIVVGMSYRRLSSSPFFDPYRLEQGRVELPRSPHSFLAALGRGRLDGGLFSALAQLRVMDWERTLLRAWALGLPLPRDRGARHQIDLSPDTVRTPAEKQFLADLAWTVDGPALRPSIEAMTGYWIDFARDMAARGSRTLFVMTPLSAEAEGMTRAHAEPVARALAAIGREFPVLDLRGLPLAAGEFRDPLHLTHAGRDRVWPTLGAAIARQGGCTQARPG